MVRLINRTGGLICGNGLACDKIFMVGHGELRTSTESTLVCLAGIRGAILGGHLPLVFTGPAVTMFDLREVQRAILLAGLGTAIVFALFTLLIQSHPPTSETAGQPAEFATANRPDSALTPDH